MISLNTYSFGYLMGLVKKDSKYVWNFDKFMDFKIKHNINCIEFPIDYLGGIRHAITYPFTE